ncbi:hypothetical protein LGT39_03645 [Demequina sp. TTPB684]|uniref:hypothetical protein n=1 Tax=unclassified Demequina TaxID=2620311 RepID=UPI001CF2BCBB|nr:MULTISPECIES: hypothetical protein [unclassified Demequina]MCB2411941.1 hypothetical protein [Demequina sp. TTPB684]UPU88064.1 hypothetical protein LGT36_012565 [Demequina sp. TMPB413]
MAWSRGDVLLRGVEVAIGAAVATAIFLAISSGWLVSGAQKFSDWYASEVDGLLNITVVSTAVTPPQPERTNLPVRDRDTYITPATVTEGEVALSGTPQASPTAASD